MYANYLKKFVLYLEMVGSGLDRCRVYISKYNGECVALDHDFRYINKLSGKLHSERNFNEMKIVGLKNFLLIR